MGRADLTAVEYRFAAPQEVVVAAGRVAPDAARAMTIQPAATISSAAATGPSLTQGDVARM